MPGGFLPVCPFAKLSMLRLLTIEWHRCLLYRVISFTPGRYGVEYAERADEIRSAAQKCGAKDILMEHFDENALQFCLLPLCEDEKLRLHIHLENGRQLNAFILLLDLFVGVRALAFADASIEPALIEAAASRRRLLVPDWRTHPACAQQTGHAFHTVCQ